MYSSRITAPLPPNPQTEDIFSAALSTIFTDDVQNSHGTPGSSVTYHSPRFGKIELRIPQHPDVEEGRKLFAHYLWNAGVICADAFEEAARLDGEGPITQGNKESRVDWDKRYWDVKDMRVLELGAGTALPSIISALVGAFSTTITDHPSSPALTTGAIEQNVRVNMIERQKQNAPTENTDTTEPISDTSTVTTQSEPPRSSEINIFGYTWGTTTFYDPSSYGRPSTNQPTCFDRIILADCLWMPSQHTNLARSVVQYLDQSRPDACALVVAGFHTGREIVRQFFEVATGEYSPTVAAHDFYNDGNKEDEGEEANKREESRATKGEANQGQLRAAEIFEIYVNGLRRPWQPVREGETKDIAKRWCVVAVLVRK